MKSTIMIHLTKLILLIIIGLMINVNAFSQYTLPETPRDRLIPMTPEASMFNKYGNLTVNKSKGISEISIPLYDLVVDDVKIPINLSYNSSGVQVTDITGIVGANWRLSAGGMIYRTIRGNPDEGDAGWFGCQCQSNYNLLGTWASSPNLYQIQLEDFATNENMDQQPDLFGFNLGGFSGSFYFTHNGDIITSGYVPFKIEAYEGQDSNGTFLYFMITDGKGNVYYFGETATSREEDELICKNKGNTIPFKSGVGDTGWKLTRIVTNKGKTISLNYEHYSFGHTYVASHQFTQYGEESQYFLEEPLEGIRNHPYFEEIYNEHIYKSSLLTSIIDSHNSIYLQYNTIENYYGWKKVLSELLIEDYYQGQIKKYIFNVRPTTSGQLFLDNIKEVGTINSDTLSQGYSFTYSTTSIDRLGSVGRDFFGYYNGQTDNETLIACPSNFDFGFGGNRRVDFNYLTQGTLFSMSYPTGGRTDFEYEANCVNNEYSGGLRIKRIVDYDENNTAFNDRRYSYKGLTGRHIHQDQYTQTGFVKDFIPSLYGTDFVLYSEDPNLKFENVVDFYYQNVIETFYKNEIPEKRIKDQFSATINGSSYSPIQLNQKLEANSGVTSYDTTWSTVKEITYTYDQNNSSTPFYISLDSYLQEFGTPVTYYPGLSVQEVKLANPKVNSLITKEYSVSNLPFVTRTFYTYNTHGLVKTVINDNISSENQIGTILTKEHTNYPEDITSNIYEGMVDNNMLDFPIERIVETNNIVTKSQLTLYKDTCSMFLPDKIYTSNPGVTFSNFTPYLGSAIATWYETDNPDIWFKTYFNDGNPLVIHNKDGITTNYIWGYNHKYPIAKIQGLVNSANIVDIQEDIEEEEAGYIGGDYLTFLKSKFSSILSNADLRLTLYTFSPSLGISSITDPNENSVYYEYDQFGRLKRIRDSDLNIMRFFKYNYHKGELPGN